MLVICDTAYQNANHFYQSKICSFIQFCSVLFSFFLFRYRFCSTLIRVQYLNKKIKWAEWSTFNFDVNFSVFNIQCVRLDRKMMLFFSTILRLMWIIHVFMVMNRQPKHCMLVAGFDGIKTAKQEIFENWARETETDRQRARDEEYVKE